MYTRTKEQFERMRYFSQLAGPLRTPDVDSPYRVHFLNLGSSDNFVYQYWVRVIAYGALVLALAFAYMLFQPNHWIVFSQTNPVTRIENWIMLGCLALLQIFAIAGTLSAARATVRAANPVPVVPPKNLRVAFVTTRAPGEPVEMVRTTLEAAKRVQNIGGSVDVWLLDETNDKELHAVCDDLNVRYFSRNGIKKYNTIKGGNPFFAGRSKHGNFNSWLDHLKKHKIDYDLLAGVDTDQVPEPNFLERLLGYFRDPDVAYVVGPQVYGNYRPGLRGLVARWAESQASFFQSTIQRAGNATNSPMFVGTNYAVRMKALRQIGGFQPCITEDMATGLAIHGKRNLDTGKRWKSVYTPDVLAIGEGPGFWGPYFTQQWRWAAGTFDTWRRMGISTLFRLPPRILLHYILMLTFYPMAALTWLLAIVSSLLYLFTGATAIQAPWDKFISLYMMSLVMQLSLYFWNRRYNVSPHEPGGSFGISGMILSTLTAPIYLSALIGTILGRRAHFVVTTKGAEQTNPDGWSAFRLHLGWAVLMSIGLVYGLLHGHAHPAMLVWAVSILVICLAPVTLGMTVVFADRIKAYRKASNKLKGGLQHAEIAN